MPSPNRSSWFPSDLVIAPASRWPTTLAGDTVRFALEAPIPIDSTDPRAAPARARISIVIVCFDNLAFTKLCLASVLVNTDELDYEVIVVDNGSTDGTAEYLRELARRHRHVHVVFSEINRGFSGATNLGLSRAIGDVLVLLNNDTIVPPHWLARLIRHLDDPAIGLIGPVTGSAGNEAEIEVSYRTYGEMVDFARQRSSEHAGRLLDLRVVMMFCLLMRRGVYELLGPLDERFEIGLFEDDDYAMRAKQHGFRVVCAEDAFVHHFGQASTGMMGPAGTYKAIFRRNRQRWEEKWGRQWQPHPHRPNQRYQRTIETLRTWVLGSVPPDATVAVVSSGDDELLQFGGRRAWHFPRTDEGAYVGFHPQDSDAAIAALEQARSAGAEFLVLPSHALWWLEHYAEFGEHIAQRYPIVVRDEDSCVIFDLR